MAVEGESLVKLTSIYLDKVKDTYEILGLIRDLHSLKAEEGERIPVSAKENLKLALQFLKVQAEAVERLLE